jgi:hypothetical protein
MMPVMYLVVGQLKVTDAQQTLCRMVTRLGIIADVNVSVMSRASLCKADSSF